MSNPCVQELESIRDFFDRSTRWLTAEDGAFVPAVGMFTAAQQVAHVAQTIDWFIDGGFGDGFRMDFEAMETEVRNTDLSAARAWLTRAFDRALEVFGRATPEELAETLPADCIMGPIPKSHILSAVSDHTAHHRGALTVYARLCGKIAPMPYMEMPED